MNRVSSLDIAALGKVAALLDGLANAFTSFLPQPQ